MNSFPKDSIPQSLLAKRVKSSGDLSCVDMRGIRHLSRELNLPEIQIMKMLLSQNIWPERFLRSRESFSAKTLIRLLSSSVLIAGCGGLGGHLSALLARMGIGTLILCDPDTFEESNLNRQHFCTEKTLGRLKVEVCREGLLEIASHMNIEAMPLELDENNLPDLLTGVDATADCLDSVRKKKMLEKAAHNAGVPYLHGAVARHEGFAFLDKEKSINLSALYADPENKNGNMNTTGLAVAGTACIMASLLVNLLGNEKSHRGRLFHMDISVPELESFSLI